MKFPLFSPHTLALLALSPSPSLVAAAALPVAQTVAVQPGHEANQQPTIWPDTPVCATAGLENGLNDLDAYATDLMCSGRDLPKDPPWDMDTLNRDWPCLCKARGGKGAAIKSAGITFFFLYCGTDMTFAGQSRSKPIIKKPDIWDATPPCASWGLDIGINDLHNPNVSLCGGRGPHEDPPFVLGSRRQRDRHQVQSAGIIFFFLNCGVHDTYFDVVFPAIEKFCEQFDWI